MRPLASSPPDQRRRWRLRVALTAGVLLLFALGAGGPAWAAGAERPSEIIWDPAAEPSWAQVFGGAGASQDEARAVAIAPSGAVFVAGTVNVGPASDASLMKFVGGEPVWAAPKTYNGPASSIDTAEFIAIGPGNTIYTAGASIGASGLADILVIRWSTAGVVKWAKRYNGPANGVDWASGIGVDANGNVTVCGTSVDAASNDWVVVSWNKSGGRRWVGRIEAPAGEATMPIDLVVAPDNSVYVAGVHVSATTPEAVTARYSATGSRRWMRTYRGPANNGAWAAGVANAPGGGVYIAGAMLSATATRNGLVVRYSSQGTRDVFTPDTGGAAANAEFNAVAVAANGQVAAVGTSTTGGNSDCRAVLYTADGTIASAATLPGTWEDEFIAVATDDFGGCYAAGTVHVAADRTAIITWRFSAITGGGGFLSLWAPAFVTDATRANGLAVQGVTACVVGQTDQGGGLSRDQFALGWSY